MITSIVIITSEISTNMSSDITSDIGMVMNDR